MSKPEHALADKPEALRTAASVARFAPSIHNTQPWQWSIAADAMELFTDRKRHMRLTDPEGRLMVLSCGAALRYAQIALEVQGYRNPAVYRLGQARADSDDVMLARLTPGGQVEPSEESIHELRLLMLRRTDRGAVRDEAVSPSVLERLRATCEENGAYLHVLRDEQVTQLAVITGHAQRIVESDSRRLAELDEWAAAHQEEGVGVPAESVNVDPGRVRVAPRRFGVARPLPPQESTQDDSGDAAASYAVLYAPDDAAPAWLRAGEALVAMWLEATDAGVSVEPFSETIEVDAARAQLSQLIGDVGYPLLVLRLGLSRKPEFTAAWTPRLSVAEILREARA
ncbi:Acg family FMN-binding oxidoreductase [Stackebrandtia nassauensis]|nr:nitroreductase [Stackebrandtia nassauensis]